MKDLQQFVSDTYVQYAEDDRLTFAMLQKYGYEARFLEEIEQRIIKTTFQESEMLHQLVNDTYSLAYKGMVDGVLNSAPDALDAAFAGSVAMTPEQIKNVVQNPVMDLALSRNHSAIVYDIKQAVAVGMMNGDRYTTVARRIAELLDSDKGAYKKAIRIARTETHRVREAGNHDAAMYVDTELQKGTTGMRMTKKWLSMKDERVRPQKLKKTKKGWVKTMGKGPDHMKMHGQIVLEDELFDLLDGNSTMMPGSSGVAGHDINCRCTVRRELMTEAEYYAKTGKHFPKR